MKQSHKHIGELVRQMREDAGLSVRELAHRVAKVSAATITNIERKGVIGRCRRLLHYEHVRCLTA
jgi:ribosome-binding protein aMBF1 (putative translation factor)